MNPQQYNQYVKEKMPKSKILKNVCIAFLVGGAICLLGQALFALLENAGLNEQDAATWVSVILVFLGSLLTGLGWYDKLAKHAGAGSLVPITGFANAIVAPAMEFKAEGFVLGVGARIFTIAGSVITFGVISSVAAGIICLLINVFPHFL
ncbi:MAG: stage V sporulation protein AC [Clostridiales bacterium]|nr:stage V sporulation protein AC [Clostridiales bacterium]